MPHPPGENQPRTSECVGTRRKAILLTNMPAPYRIPQFNLLAKSPHFAFKFLFYCRTEPNRSWDVRALADAIEFEHEYLDVRPLATKVGHSYIAPTFLKRLIDEKPYAILVCGFSFQLLLAELYAALSGARVFVWTDSNVLDEMKLPRWRTLLRRRLIRRIQGAIATSTRGVEYFRYLGVPADRIVVSRYVNDPRQIRHLVRRFRADREENVKGLGIPASSFVILFAGRLEEDKGCRELLRAVARTRAATQRRLHLMIVGDGSLRGEMEALVAGAQMNEAVTFTGFKQYAEMPFYYALADLVVFPSLREPYGLIVNEAIAAGAPVPCRKFAGSADLMNDERYGFLFDPNDETEFCAALARAIMSPRWQTSCDADMLPREILPEVANEAIERALRL